MKIQVLGSGCSTCKKLYKLVQQAVTELGLDIEVEYSTDVRQIVAMGVMQSPVVAIDGKPVITGFLGDTNKIKEIIRKNIGI